MTHRDERGCVGCRGVDITCHLEMTVTPLAGIGLGVGTAWEGEFEL